LPPERSAAVAIPLIANVNPPTGECVAGATREHAGNVSRMDQGITLRASLQGIRAAPPDADHGRSLIASLTI
jgi:hypothetical protein